MAREPKNYIDHIHNYDWRAAYHATRFTAESYVASGGRRTESLNGVWRYAVDQYATSLRAAWYKEVGELDGRPIPPDYDFDAWEEMTIPTSWNTAAERLFLYEGHIAFTRTFRMEKRAGERVFINFGAAQYRTYVFLNREYLGVHFGGSTPFSVEVTDHLDTDNRIVVVVDNTRDDRHGPMSNTDWFNYEGPYPGTSQKVQAFVGGAFSANPNNNALRWGTSYSFHFHADTAPQASQVGIIMFKPGGPNLLFANAEAPM